MMQRRQLLWLMATLPLLLSGCGPKPPETFLQEYFQLLILQSDRNQALQLVQYPAGIDPPPDLLGGFAAEESWLGAMQALFAKEQAQDPVSRRRLWQRWRKDKWVQWHRQHTTRTTATVRVRVESALFRAAGAEAPSVVELNYVLIRLNDQTWRLSKVEVADWQRGQPSR